MRESERKREGSREKRVCGHSCPPSHGGGGERGGEREREGGGLGVEREGEREKRESEGDERRGWGEGRSEEHTSELQSR